MIKRKIRNYGKYLYMIDLLILLSINVFSSAILDNHFNNITVAAFYHVFAHGKFYKAIINDQLQTLQATGLLDRIDRIFYTTIGKDCYVFNLTIEKSQKILALSEGNELETMSAIYNFCIKNPFTKILYFHNKGSFHYDENRESWRKAMDCFVLSPHCLDVLNQYDTCGLRLSAFPHPHYSGNFFWASCNHINKLKPPRVMSKEIDLWFSSRNSFNKEYGCVQSEFGAGRYLSESWVTSAPNFNPADCVNATIDNIYTFGHITQHTSKIPFQKYCPNFISPIETRPNGSYGLPCHQAAMLISRFPPRTNVVKPNCTTLNILIDRSCMWYNQYPETLAMMRKNAFGLNIGEKDNRTCEKYRNGRMV